MWTKINQVYATPHSQNVWAFAAATNKWHQVAKTSVDGSTNVFLLLATAQGSGKQVYLITDANSAITGAYL